MAKRSEFKIILPKSKTLVSSVISTGDSVKTNMTKNLAVFPDPVPTLDDLGTALQALKDSVPPENERSTASNNLTEKLKKEFIENYLKPLSGYVLFVAKGDRYKAGLSGFELSKEDTVERAPGEIEAVFVGPGPSEGTAKVRILNRAGNALFKVYLKVDDKWVMLDAFNTLTFIVKNLPSGSSQLRIIGKKGDLESPPVDITVKAY